MDKLDEWYQSMLRLGEADVPMEINGRIQTPREYMRSMGRRA